ncbi:MAG: TMEM43 family protein [Rudaea sp.]
MARRKKLSLRRIAGLVALVLLIVLGAWAWQHQAEVRPLASPIASVPSPPPQTAAGTSAASSASVQLSGKLQIQQAPRDAQLGVSAADAALLLRSVAMYQWQEHCDGAACRYATEWSAQHIDSGKFRVPAGHENPASPFADAQFGGDVRLGELSVDPQLVAAQHPAIDYPVKANALPPNLAATFSVVGGVLYAGGDAAHPRVGTLRISYRIVPGGEVSVSGVRHGSKLEAR